MKLYLGVLDRRISRFVGEYQNEVSEIRDKIRCDEISAEQVYIQMQQHIKNDIRSGFDTWFNLEDHDMYNFPEEAMQASWEASSKELKSSLDDADRRAGAYLTHTFSLNSKEASKVLAYWMTTYTTRHPQE